MADVVGSSRQPGQALASQLQQLVAALNTQFAADVLSPLTVTLGDEFQGVVASKAAGMRMLLAADAWLLAHRAAFKLRYVLWLGTIDTPINTTIAHGMLGEGLTEARQRLQALKDEKDKRFYVGHRQPDTVLNELLFLHHSITSQWKPKDYPLITALLQTGDYKAAARQLGKDSSLVWRRQKSLQLPQLKAVEHLIENEISHQP